MQGGCLCGSVRYQLESPPREAYYCHCRDCQYLSGSAFHLIGIVDRSAFSRLCGELGQYTRRTEDGSEMTREFCLSCGSPLYMTSSRFVDIQMFALNSLDQPDIIEPGFEIWTRSKCGAAHIDADITSFRHGALDD